MEKKSMQKNLKLSELRAGRKGQQIVVRILNIWKAHNTKLENHIMSLEMLFLDEEDKTIQGTVWAEWIEQFEDRLAEGNIYELKSFDVKQNRQNYRVCDNALKLHFLKNTKIRDVAENEVTIRRHFFRYDDYETLLDKADSKFDLPDIIGQAIRISNLATTKEKGIPKRDIEIMFSREQKVVLTLWDKQATSLEEKITELSDSAPIIIATAINPKKYKGILALSGSSATKILFNPEIEETKKFIARAKLDTKMLQIGDSSKAMSDKDEPLQITPIAELLQFVEEQKPQTTTFTCLATIEKVSDEKGWSYIACSKCFSKLIEVDDTLECEKCSKSKSNAVLRYRLQLNVEDNSGKCVFVMFDKEATRLLNVAASDLAEIGGKAGGSEKTLTNMSTDIPEHVRMIENKQFVFKVKITPFNFSSMKNNFTVVSYSENTAEHETQKIEDTDEYINSGLGKQQKRLGKRKVRIVESSSENEDNDIQKGSKKMDE